ncbi:MAG TPA: YbhB/YbcL family Raf kinase inhibitor-like protein [Mycobacteriales bacterium]|nr:YbhB/YbcL family Raf kinase inhibitor-like protein [Mycobacteriales bacterium]
MPVLRSRPPSPYDLLPEVPSFGLRSDDVSDGASVPTDFIHDSAGGKNISPHLAWDAPADAQGFVVTCFDPDAPTHSGFWHWVVLDIPAGTTELPQGAGAEGGAGLPAGAYMLRNDYGSVSYGGCAPPPGDGPHRYFFAVHALDTASFGLPKEASCAFAGFNLAFHTVGRGLLVPTYEQT